MKKTRSLIWAGAGVVLLLAGLVHADSKLKGWLTKVDPAAQTIEVGGQTVSTRDVRVTGGPLDVGVFVSIDKGRIKVKPQRRPADDQVIQYPAKGQSNPGRAEFSHVRHFNALGAKQCTTCHSPEMGLTASSSRAGGAPSSALDPHAPQSIGHFCANCHDGTRRPSQGGILGGRADRVVFTSLKTADPRSCQRCHAPADHGRDFTAAHGHLAEHSGGKPCLGCHSQSWTARDQALHAGVPGRREDPQDKSRRSEGRARGRPRELLRRLPPGGRQMAMSANLARPSWSKWVRYCQELGDGDQWFPFALTGSRCHWHGRRVDAV